MDYRIAFEDLPWEPALGATARMKRIVREGKVFRLVEMTPQSSHDHWCEVGHIGMLVEGELEVTFDNGRTLFHAGDALMFPAGAKDRHRPRALTPRAVMFLIEDEVA